MTVFNKSEVTEYLLVGFSLAKKFKLFLFLFFLFIYIAIILGNAAIILLVWTQPRLKTPMYLFLSNLSFLEICYTSVTLPKMLEGLLFATQKIPVIGCIAQCYFFFVLGANENYFLAVMAYDRYLAICNPLRYSLIMSSLFCSNLVIGCWGCSIFGSFLPLYWLCNLSFCGPLQINHFFCDVVPLLSRSCTDASMLMTYFFITAWIIIFSCLLFIISSYLQIIMIILSIPSTGRRKAFSTCVSHLTVVSIYYSSVILNRDFDKTVSLLYAVVPPLFNPIIYSWRNKDVRDTMYLVYLRNINNSNSVKATKKKTSIQL